jgi:hypothetical protein
MKWLLVLVLSNNHMVIVPQPYDTREHCLQAGAYFPRDGYIGRDFRCIPVK